MRLVVSIRMDNDAFQPDAEPEAARILHLLADRCGGGILRAGQRQAIMDVNGNKVGEIKILK